MLKRFGSTSGLTLLKEEPHNPAHSAVAHVSAAYSSGFMSGPIRLALAESTADLTSLVGGTVTDRSIAGNNATVNGTVTRTAVASGAELAAYGGFSASNYLEVPYDADFDFGTGDFCGLLWLIQNPNSTWEAIIDCFGPLRTSGSGFDLYVNPDGTLGMRQFQEGVFWGLSHPQAVDTSQPILVAFGRRNGSGFISLNGASEIRSPSAQNVSTLGGPLVIGGRGNGTEPLTNGSIALPRITAFAPDPAQIAAIYEAERHLFQPNAKCLLPSANVQSLAYDDSRDELLVGTTAGTAVYKGLVRTELVNVAGVADAALLSSDDHNVVAAGAGIRVIGSAAEAYATLPAIPLREKVTGAPVTEAYDPNVIHYEGVTTDATPTVIGRFPVAEGKAYGFTAHVSCSEYADPTDEGAMYVIEGRVHRGIGGNIVVNATTRTIHEATGTMDCAASANTTTQTLDITLTGVASERIVHKIELRLLEVA